MILIFCIHRIFETSWAFRGSWCLKCIYRCRIMSWYCCVVQFALFSCIPLLLLISVLHWKTLQAQSNVCFWHRAHSRVVLPHEASVVQIIIAKGHCDHLFKFPVATQVSRLQTDSCLNYNESFGKKVSNCDLSISSDGESITILCNW